MGGSGASATVVVQVGQCGNQLGGALLDELHAHDCGGEGAYFREGGRGASVARAVLLDTEPKVVRAALDRGGVGWRYDGGGAAVIGGGGGAGNNWASGFYEHGAAAAELACERVRREAEHADALGGMLLVHSVAGGTGSGAGCAAAAALRDAFPAVNMLSCAVCPFESGEVAVQSYNALLTLDAVSAAADGIILQRNESLASLATSRYGVRSPALSDLNGLAADAIASCLAHSGASHAGCSHSSSPLRPLPDLCEHLCCHPAYKLLTPHVAPHVPHAARDFEKLHWPAVLKELRRSMEARAQNVHAANPRCAGGRAGGGSVGGDGVTVQACRALSSAVVLRGDGASQMDASEVCAPELYARWSPAGARTLVAAGPRRSSAALAKRAAALCNSSAAVPPVAAAAERAYSMYAARAYVHQYEAHGGSAADIEAGLAAAEETLSSYAALHQELP